MIIEKIEVTAETVTEETPIKLVFEPEVPPEQLTNIKDLKKELGIIDSKIAEDKKKLENAMAHVENIMAGLNLRRNAIIDILKLIDSDNDIDYKIVDMPTKTIVELE
jgi:dynactin complex subunit